MITPRVLLLTISFAVMTAACIRRESTTVEVTPDDMQSSSDLRSATNLPAQFVVVTAAATPRDCPPELSDPGLGTTLRLHRSVLRPPPDTSVAGYRAIGDYSVQPPGLYGEEPGEGLRVDCSRLRAVGVVRL